MRYPLIHVNHRRKQSYPLPTASNNNKAGCKATQVLPRYTNRDVNSSFPPSYSGSYTRRYRYQDTDPGARRIYPRASDMRQRARGLAVPPTSPASHRILPSTSAVQNGSCSPVLPFEIFFFERLSEFLDFRARQWYFAHWSLHVKISRLGAIGKFAWCGLEGWQVVSIC